jgi:mRNA interferase MazF
MDKDFNKWNILKQKVEIENVNYVVKEGEIWWCWIGINIGIEINGKDDAFARPVLILKKFNDRMFLVLPLTTKNKVDKYHHKLIGSRDSRVILSQVRVISNKRLTRSIFSIGFRELCMIKEKFKSLI